MRRLLPAAVAALIVVSMPTSCGDEQPPAAGSDQEPLAVEITFDGDTATPDGERVQVEVGQPIELVVIADAGGELHVHSRPEQRLEYGEGTTRLPLTFDEPGVVDVESRELQVVVVRLEVG